MTFKKIIEICEKYLIFQNSNRKRGVLILVDEPLDNFTEILQLPRVKELRLCPAFSHPVDNVPQNIEKLSIREWIKSEFYPKPYTRDDKLEIEIKKIFEMPTMKCECKFNQSVSNLPLGLKEFDIRSEYLTQTLEQLSPTLEILRLYIKYSVFIEQNFANLPLKLKVLSIHLTVSDVVADPIKFVNFPNSIRKLFIDINKSWSCDFTVLPKKIRCLDLGYNFNGSLEHLPRKLKILGFVTRDFNSELYLEPYAIPKTLKRFNCYYENDTCYYIKEKNPNVTVYFEDEGIFW